MSGQADIRTAIVNAATAAADRVYAITYDGIPVRPYIIVTRIDGVPNVNFQSSNLVRFRYQVDVFADTLAQSQTIAEQVVIAMEGSAFQAVTLSFFDTYEDEVKLYRVSIDFSVWQ